MSNNNAQRAQKTADLIDKMCRKISQLTRVVYVLNSKNDDHEELINAIVQAYETELINLTREGNLVNKKAKSQLDKIKSANNPDVTIREINDKFSSQVQKFSADVEKSKKDYFNSNKKMREEYEQKYNKMIKDTVEMRKLYDSKINEINSKNEELKRKSILEQQKLASNSTTEIERIKRSYEDKIADLKKSHENQINEIKSINQSELNKMTANYEKKIKEVVCLSE